MRERLRKRENKRAQERERIRESESKRESETEREKQREKGSNERSKVNAININMNIKWIKSMNEMNNLRYHPEHS